jgi:hypothetical protein
MCFCYGVMYSQRTAASSLRNSTLAPKRGAVFCSALNDSLSGFSDITVLVSASLTLGTIGSSVQKMLSACSFASMLRKIPIWLNRGAVSRKWRRHKMGYQNWLGANGGPNIKAMPSLPHLLMYRLRTYRPPSFVRRCWEI